ncbi:MAG: oligosaccharide flippase family protein [Gemmatimonadaceae bacterium]|nr:oligosaccharide flippase family protein [Gemmatimonadaceae bacterium]
MTAAAPARLRVAAAWATVGNTAWAGAQWLTVWALARFTGAAALGDYAYVLATVVPVFALTNLQLRELLATDARGAHDVSTYLRVRWMGCAAGTMLVALVLALLGRPVPLALAGLVIATKVLEGVAELRVAQAQRAERWMLVAGALGARGVAVGLAAIVTAATTRDSRATVLAVCLAQVIVLLGIERRLPRRLGAMAGTSPAPAADAQGLVLGALPLGIAAVLNAGYTNLPRLALGRLVGSAALGGYAAASTLLVPIGLLAGVVAAVAGPRLAGALARDDLVTARRLLGAITGAALFAGAALVLLVVWCGAFATQVAFGDRFPGIEEVLVPLAVATAASVVGGVLGVAVTAGRILRPQLWVHIGATICLAVGCAIFIPPGGAVGAAWAQALGAGCATLGFAALALSLLRRRP